MEIIKVGEKTYYIKNNTNIGIYKVNDNDVYLIDAGNDKDAGKKVLKIVADQGWSVKGVISTHSHADHIGGNRIIQDRTSCIILANKIEKCFTEYPVLEPSLLYGAYPFKDLTNKFLMAKESNVVDIEGNLPDGLEFFDLKGHSFDMVGIKTSDDVYFLADSLVSEQTIKKYHLFFLYDVKEYIATLEFLSTLSGKLYIPSHCDATDNITHLIDINREKITEICNVICDICNKEKTFEEILKAVFDKYNLTMDVNQYVLVGSTLKAYLSYLYNEDKLTYNIKDNKMTWIVK